MWALWPSLLVILLLDARPAEVSLESQEQFTIWAAACYRLHDTYPCGNIPPPILEDLDEKRCEDQNGSYGGGPVIELCPDLDNDQLVYTSYHEYVHYLQWWVGGHRIPTTWEKMCKMEEEAHIFTGEFVTETLHRPDLVRPQWWKRYEDCWQWYATPEWLYYQRGRHR